MSVNGTSGGTIAETGTSADKPMSRTKKVIIGVLVGTFTSAALYEMAKKLGIKGTSNMTKMKRARAIVKHNWKKVGAVLISMGLLTAGYRIIKSKPGETEESKTEESKEGETA